MFNGVLNTALYIENIILNMFKGRNENTKWVCLNVLKGN